MRGGLALPALLGLAACSSTPPGTSALVLNDPYWDRVNVEIVVTNRADCDSRAEGFVSTKQLVMRKNATERFEIPAGANICWRHDRNPDKPEPGVWSGWTKASVPPGKSAETDL